MKTKKYEQCIQSIISNDLEFLKHLLSNETSLHPPRQISSLPMSPLIVLASDYKRVSIVEYIVNGGFEYNIDSVDYNGDTALVRACFNGSPYIAKLLLSNGANPNYQESESSLSPLSWAIVNGSISIVKELIIHGVVIPQNIHKRFNTMNDDIRKLLHDIMKIQSICS